MSGVRGYAYSGCEGVDIRCTMVCIFGVRGYIYSGYGGMNIRGTMI